MSVSYHKLEISYPGRFSKQEGTHDFSRELIDLATFDFSDKREYGLFPDNSELPLLTEKGHEIIDDGKFGRVTACWSDVASIEDILNSTIGHWRDCALSKWSPSEERSDE
jgi:hypothetical protein